MLSRIRLAIPTLTSHSVFLQPLQSDVRPSLWCVMFDPHSRVARSSPHLPVPPPRAPHGHICHLTSSSITLPTPLAPLVCCELSHTHSSVLWKVQPPLLSPALSVCLPLHILIFVPFASRSSPCYALLLFLSVAA